MRRRLGGADQQAGTVVHEGQVADQRDGAALVGQRGPIAVDTVPSMPATPRLERTLMPCGLSPTSAASRTGLDAPSTS
ncbi:2-succinyl-5-enolpyruvyl-6-hydroxy-3-cyclohexene-1-carboxylate synthase domain protein [Mycobacterium xenopi 4042]|uniref:2-succinyl-5-enolpyruvyl-6-hydroxy-3-cyclohexene-1-carboxylate synthase domain protein n=1 Tax=Mycobacterium xenopi 4042 TaxID=1299334 RepID=X8C9B9_MYCXE|nr:2-succinyl-5-enolpyruvyl-6-hydroxy-3-cyclohexene-1-carboxylate synthase domain protein [Mycobacterium xenopi 4042]